MPPSREVLRSPIARRRRVLGPPPGREGPAAPRPPAARPGAPRQAPPRGRRRALAAARLASYVGAVLTAVMTTRDRAERLARSLDAWEALETPRGGYRLVVADDGSRDATSAVLAARAGRLPLLARRGPPRGQ